MWIVQDFVSMFFDRRFDQRRLCRQQRSDGGVLGGELGSEAVSAATSGGDFAVERASQDERGTR